MIRAAVGCRPAPDRRATQAGAVGRQAAVSMDNDAQCAALSGRPERNSGCLVTAANFGFWKTKPVAQAGRGHGQFRPDRLEEGRAGGASAPVMRHQQQLCRFHALEQQARLDGFRDVAAQQDVAVVPLNRDHAGTVVPQVRERAPTGATPGTPWRAISTPLERGTGRLPAVDAGDWRRMWPLDTVPAATISLLRGPCRHG